MIKTDVKELATHEYEVHVTVVQSEYDRVYADQMKKLTSQAKLPGFRPGKTPAHVIKKQFGPKIHEETVSALIQSHYVTAIESSGLKPAVQPMIDIPSVQSAEGFEFTMKVATWPEVELADVSKLAFNETTVTVENADIEQVIERLMKSQVKFEIEAERASENGDQLHIDFVGSIDGEAFDGGKGEDVPLVLGEARFIPGFEEQLIGKKAGDDVDVTVSFPEDYQAAHLAGKAAEFATHIKSVGKPITATNEDELAALVGFEDGAALNADAQKRLAEEAEQASYSTTRDAALDALIAANAMELPEPLIAQDMQESAKRVLANMKEQGMETPEEMLKDEAFIQEIRNRSERGLKLSILLQQVREKADLNVDDAELEAEMDRQSQQYPEVQRDQFKAWIKSQKEQVASMQDALLERKCIAYLVEKATTTAANTSLSDWQAEQAQ
ncbi:MAG: trigger factor [Mariprofundus sp.]|nr:trigger factor [Mariprofundus sp.]